MHIINNNSLYQKTSKKSLYDNDDDDKSTTDSHSYSFDENDLDGIDLLREEFKIIDGRLFINLENSCQIIAVDERSMTNMDILEILYEHIWKGKFSAPIQDKLACSNMCVLDIGSGTGSWITSMAESYPKSSFIGLDLINFKKDNDLPNLAFIRGNIFDGLPFPDNTFDYVHQSNMMISIQKDQWKFVIDEIVRVTKPNGWMEFMERDPRSNSLGPVMDELSKLFVSYLRSSGVHTKINKELEKMLRSTNQVTDVGILSKGIPIGSWGGYVGELFSKTFDELYSARSSGFLDFTRMPEEVLIEKKVKIAPLEYNKYKTYAKVYRTYGRKI